MVYWAVFDTYSSDSAQDSVIMDINRLPASLFRYSLTIPQAQGGYRFCSSTPVSLGLFIQLAPPTEGLKFPLLSSHIT